MLARGAGEEALDRHTDAGADDAAEEFRVRGNNIEVDGGAEIDGDARSAVFVERRDAIDQTIGSDFARIIVADFDAEVDGVVDEHGLALEIFFSHRHERLIDGGDHA